MEGFQSLSLSQQRVVDSEIFPLCLTKDSSCARTGSLFDMVESQREQMDDLLRRHRAILFRDCGLRDAQDLHNFIEATGLNGMEYVGGAAVRTQLTSKVFTANESPSSEKIPFHHEMA